MSDCELLGNWDNVDFTSESLTVAQYMAQWRNSIICKKKKKKRYIKECSRIAYIQVTIIHGGKNNDRNLPRVLLNPRGESFSFFGVEVSIRNRLVT